MANKFFTVTGFHQWGGDISVIDDKRVYPTFKAAEKRLVEIFTETVNEIDDEKDESGVYNPNGSNVVKMNYKGHLMELHIVEHKV